MLISIVCRTKPETMHFPRQSNRHSPVKISTQGKWGGPRAMRYFLMRVNGSFHIHARPQHEA
jgi:hypothetical protein